MRHVIELPIRTVSGANVREHWAKRAKRARVERYGCYIATPVAKVPCSVKLVRIAPRPLDSDNLAISFKACRDGIADRLGVDDGDSRIDWQYAQEKGEPKQYAIRIEIEEKDQ